MTRIFYDSNMPAETHYRTCDGLLNLQRSSEPVVFRTACETALRHGPVSYTHLDVYKRQHLSSTSNHVLHIVGVTRAVYVCVVTLVGLCLLYTSRCV